MQNSKSDEKQLPPSLQKVLEASLLANYLQNFSSIKTYRQVNQGKQLLQLIQKSTGAQASTKVIKKMFTFFKHAQAQGKVCMMQFLKELIEIDNVSVYIEIEKHIPSIFCEICEYRAHIKNIGRGSSFFMKEQSLHENSDKFNEIIKLSNTYFRMIHEMLYVWGQCYFPESRYSTLYAKIAERCTFPEYPSEFKFYSTQKVNKLSKLLVQINRHIASKKAIKQEEEDKKSTQTLKIRTKKRQQSVQLEQEYEPKKSTKEPVQVPKISKKVQEQKQQQMLSIESSNKQAQEEREQTQNEQEQIDEIQLLRNSTKSSSQFIAQSKQKKLKKQGRKPIPPNLIYRQSSIEDPVDMTKNITKATKYSSPADINMTPKRVSLEVPMGMIQERSSQSKTTPKTKTQPKGSSIEEKKESKKSPKQQVIIEQPLSQERQMYSYDQSSISNQARESEKNQIQRSRVNVKEINMSNFLSENSISEDISRNHDSSGQKEDEENIVPESSITYSQLLKKQQQDTHQSKMTQKNKSTFQPTERVTLNKLLNKQKESIAEREIEIEKEKQKQIEIKKEKERQVQIRKDKELKQRQQNRQKRDEIRQKLSPQKLVKESKEKKESKKIDQNKITSQKNENHKSKIKDSYYETKDERREYIENSLKHQSESEENISKKKGNSKKKQQIIQKHKKTLIQSLRKHNQFSLTFYPQKNQQIADDSWAFDKKFSTLQSQIAICNSKMEQIKGIVVSELKEIKDSNSLSNLPIMSSKKIDEAPIETQNLQFYNIGPQIKKNLMSPPESTFRKKGGSSLEIHKQFSRKKQGSYTDAFVNERNIKLLSMTEKLGSTLMKSKHNSVKKSNMRMKNYQNHQDCEYGEGTMLYILSKKGKSVYI